MSREINYYTIKEVVKTNQQYRINPNRNWTRKPRLSRPNPHSRKLQSFTEDIFTEHPNTGTFPELSINLTQLVITQVTATNTWKVHAWIQQQTIVATMKTLSTNAFELQCFDELRCACTGLNWHSIRDVLAYLCERFGEASPLKLEEAEKILSSTFEAT